MCLSYSVRASHRSSCTNLAQSIVAATVQNIRRFVGKSDRVDIIFVCIDLTTEQPITQQNYIRWSTTCQHQVVWQVTTTIGSSKAAVATTLSRVHFSENVTIFRWTFTTVCCLVVGLRLGLGLGLDLVSGWLVVIMHTNLYYFLLSLSHHLHTAVYQRE